MNIWIVNHYAVPPSIASGMVRHFYFARYLQEKGHKVKIITSGRVHNTDINMIKDDSLFLSKVMDGVEYIFVRSHGYTGNGVNRIINMMGFPFEVRKTMKRLLKEERPDVIYTSSPDIFVPFFAMKFGKKRRFPVVFEVRDLWPESIVEYNGMSRKNPIIRILYRLEKWMYKNASQLIFTFPGGSEYITDQKWEKAVDLQKVNYINNGVDLQEYRKRQREKLNDPDLTNDKFRIIYMGSIRKVNNIELLVSVAAELQKRGEDGIQFLIYGDGTEKEKLEESCKAQGLANIIFKGRVEKRYIPYILSKSSLNLLNYKVSSTWKYGGSQNKQFEYLASGRPTCSNVKMGHSIIEQYKCGLERDMSTIDEYIETILYYKNMKKEEYEQQCKNAFLAAEDFDYNRLAEKVEKVLIKTQN